jgi:hypothetical protein
MKSKIIKSTTVVVCTALLGFILVNKLHASGTHNVAPNVPYSPYKYVGTNFQTVPMIISTLVAQSPDDQQAVRQPILDVISNNVNDVDTVTLGFAKGECGTESWEGLPWDPSAEVLDMFAATNFTNPDSAYSFSHYKKHYIIAVGGANASPPYTCSTDAGMDAFYKRYASDYFKGFDFDIEGSYWSWTATDIDNLVREAAHIKQQHPDLNISFTVPTFAGSVPTVVDPNDPMSSNLVSPLGLEVLDAAMKHFAKNVDGTYPFTVNLMAMDYGKPDGKSWTIENYCVPKADNITCDMAQSAIQAVKNLHESKYQLPYSNIELTLMTGENDIASQIFTVDDIKTVKDFAEQNNLGALHTWSLDRDRKCSTTLPNPGGTCNPTETTVLEYTKAFAQK